MISRIKISERIMPILASLGFVLSFSSGCSPATDAPREFGVPERTNWAPSGPRVVGGYDYDVIPKPDAFRTMHGSTNNSDNVWIAAAPMFEFDWVSETDMYVPEGPTYDNEGNLYFSPVFPQEDVSLISLNGETGERRWAITGDGLNGGSGAPLVLNDPDNPGTQIIYHASYTGVMAIRTDGTIIWKSPTGLNVPEIRPGERPQSHSYAFNYHPQQDALIGVTSDGKVFAFSRLTGKEVAPLIQLSGAPAISELPAIPARVKNASDALTDEVFGELPGGLSFYSAIVEVIFGGGDQVTNFFGIDPNSGRIYIAATAEDALDGTIDQKSEIGAIYMLDLINDGTGELELSILGHITFPGGTGSTPTISEDGSRVYVSDNLGHVMVLDPDLNEIWRINVGEPLAASIAVSPDNGEIYVVTRNDVFKIVDNGDSGTLAWAANFDALGGYANVDFESNALTPTITANGIVVSIGGGRNLLGNNIMLRVGMGLLDRDTGELRYFALGREESIAVTSVAPDGGFYTANSPVRRVSGRALFPNQTEEIIGGISRYRPIRLDIMARDAICAAATRTANAVSLGGEHVASIEEDIRQVEVLISQARTASATAILDGDMDTDFISNLDALLDEAESNLTLVTLDQAQESLSDACGTF